MISDKKKSKDLFGYRRLIAWQKSDQFAHNVYDLLMNFPKEELFGLTSQLKRSVLSVSTNIVEGYARNNKNEFRRFLAISLGSLAEVGYLLEFALKRDYIKGSDYERINENKEEVGRILWSLYNSQR